MPSFQISTRTSLAVSTALLLLAALVVSARAATPVTPPGLADCATLEIPTDREVNTLLDKVNKLLTLSYLDDSTGSDRTVTISYEDPQCLARSSVKTKIDHALQTDRVTQVQMCVSMRQGIANNETVVRGRPVDLDAARRYVDEWCS